MNINYNKIVNLDKLHDELVKANLVNPADYFGADYFVAKDDADITEINGLIEKHNPSPIPQPKNELEILKETVDTLVLSNLGVL